MKKYYSILILLLLVSMVSALDNDELSIEEPVTIYKLNYDCANIYENCDNCTQVNISKVLYPNGSVALSNVVMTKDNTYYNYTMCSLNVTGTYTINAYGDLNGQRTTDEYTIQVTNSGTDKEFTLLSIIIIVFLGLLLYFMTLSLINIIGHFADLDVDATDVSKSWGLLFVLFLLYYIINNLIPIPFFADLTKWLLIIGTITHGLLPMIALVTSLIVSGLRKQRGDFN